MGGESSAIFRPSENALRKQKESIVVNGCFLAGLFGLDLFFRFFAQEGKRLIPSDLHNISASNPIFFSLQTVHILRNLEPSFLYDVLGVGLVFQDAERFSE